MLKNQISKIRFTFKSPLLILFTGALLSACSYRFENENNLPLYAATKTSDLSVYPFMLSIPTANKILIRFDGVPKNFKATPNIAPPLALEKNANESIRLVSNKNEVLIIEHGRLINTRNLNENLLSIKATKTDPLALGLLNSKTPKTWTRAMHWSSQPQAVEVTSTFAFGGEQSILVRHLALDAYLFLEKVSIPSLEKHFVNQFWLDKHSGRLVKSIQKISPTQPNMTLLISP